MFPRADSKLAQGSAALPAGLQLRWAAGSDIGHRRRENQDSFLATPPLFLVADGMGGHAGGAQASATLLQTLARLLVVAPVRGEDGVSAPLAPTPNTPNTQAPDFWTALDQACFRVIDLSEAREDYTLSPPGTTLTGLVLRSELCEVINVGDSRTYVIENGMMTQLTRDHSQVAELVEAGIITKAQARISPNRSVITRAIGAGQNHPPLVDRWTRPLRAGQRFLICTDGLTSLLDDGEILCLLERLLPRDLRTPAENRLTHVRRSQHLAVEQDRNRTPDVLHREVGKFLRPLVREFEVDDVLPRLRIRGCLCILQIRTREHRMPLFVAELEHRRLADRSDRSIGILDARQFDDDTTLPLALDDWLGQSKRVDALLHDRNDAVHRIVVDLRLLRIDRLQTDMRSALQVKSLPNRACERLN